MQESQDEGSGWEKEKGEAMEVEQEGGGAVSMQNAIVTSN